MKKACVIGWPIKHSRSPLIHNYWLKQFNIAGTYERVAVEPENLIGFIKHLNVNNYVGCNVTIPHKELAITAVDEVDDAATKTGSINTIYLRGDRICATSTDGVGFVNSLMASHPGFVFQDKKILIIGAGGAAKSVCQSLLSEGVHSIAVHNRSQSRAIELKKLFGEKLRLIMLGDIANALAEIDLLINTTSLGMTGQPMLDFDIAKLPAHAIVADIVYVPLKTELIKTAEARGLRTVPGLGMLLHQAVKGFSLWFGVTPQVTVELFDLLAKDVDQDYQR